MVPHPFLSTGLKRWGGLQEHPAEGMPGGRNISSFGLSVSIVPPRPYELGHTVLKVPLLTFLLPVMCCVIGGIIPPSQELGEWSTPCGEAPRTGPVNGVVLHKGRVIFVCNKNVRPVHFSLRGGAASLVT